jgi:hypothetical protein
MRIVKVTYLTKPEFIAQNAVNIKSVMNDLRLLNNPGIFYHACNGPEGNAFIHTAFFKTDEDHKALNDLQSFQYFQQQLKISGFESPPKQELLTLVGCSVDIFDGF